MRPTVESLGESLRLSPQLCTPMLFVRSACRACIDACSVKALSREGSRWSLAAACDSCGACAGTCPTGALDLRSPSAAEIGAKVLQSPGSEIVLACERAGSVTSERIAVPCAARLDEAMLVSAVLQGAPRVRVAIGECRTCPRLAQVRRTFSTVMRVSRRILRASGLDPRRIRIDRPVRMPAPREDRRAFFRRIFGAGMEPEPTQAAPAEGRRNRLVAAIRAGSTKVAPAPAGELPMAKVRITADCFGCNVCEHVCAPRAIARRERPDGVTITFDAGLCTDCRACAEACLARAVQLSRADDLSALSASQPSGVATLVRRDCPQCGISFHGAGETQSCPRCRRAGDPVAKPGTAFTCRSTRAGDPP